MRSSTVLTMALLPLVLLCTDKVASAPFILGLPNPISILTGLCTIVDGVVIFVSATLNVTAPQITNLQLSSVGTSLTIVYDLLDPCKLVWAVLVVIGNIVIIVKDLIFTIVGEFLPCVTYNLTITPLGIFNNTIGPAVDKSFTIGC